jgi:hypothetical protein
MTSVILGPHLFYALLYTFECFVDRALRHTKREGKTELVNVSSARVLAPWGTLRYEACYT